MPETFLSQEEVDALLSGVTGEVDSEEVIEEVGDIRPYNLATQERIVRGRMPTLEIINERFTRLFRMGLYHFLHRTAEISVSNVRISKYTDFMRNLVMPTNLNLVNIKPLRGTALVVLDPNLVFLIIDNMFGGDGRFHTRVEGRDFTQTEQRIIQRTLEVIFDCYSKAWEFIYPIEFEYIRSEMNTQFANIATPNEVVVNMTFTIDFGQTGGEMHICIPYSMIEPVRDLLTSSMQGERLETDMRWVRLMTQQLKATEVELIADLGTCHSTIGDMLEMKVGDILPINMPDHIEVKVDGSPIMECTYGKLNGQYALKVQKLIRNDEQKSKDNSDKVQ